MKTISSTVQTLLNNPIISNFVLVKLELSINYYLTSLPYSVVFSGNTYIPNSALSDYFLAGSSSRVGKQSYRITFGDLDNTFQDEFRLGCVGKLVTVYLGFLDTNRQPLLSTNDVLLLYEGRIDGTTIIYDNQEKLAQIEVSSPFARLDIKGGFPVSKEGMDQIDEEDTSFDRIFEGSKTVEIFWGKK